MSDSEVVSSDGLILEGGLGIIYGIYVLFGIKYGVEWHRRSRVVMCYV